MKPEISSGALDGLTMTVTVAVVAVIALWRRVDLLTIVGVTAIVSVVFF